MRPAPLSILVALVLTVAAAPVGAAAAWQSGAGLGRSVAGSRVAGGTVANGSLDRDLRDALRFRSIGPLRGGRSTAVTGIAGQSKVFYMGTTGGGVWRTDDAGLSWDNLSDGYFGGSIGAIDVADSDPNVIYVGTGSACIRGNASTGHGVYRSTDAGKTWSHIGLRETGTIARVIVHPRDPDLVYVAAFGHPFGPNGERGVYRSRDGGDTWEQVQFVSDEVGAIDLSMDAHNPRVLYAAFWRFERKPWTSYDASDNGGIFKSTDGGDTWNRLAGGLPAGVTGRIGVSVSPADPERVYALVSAEDPDGGLYRSDDAGATWVRINRDRNLRQRHWYYSHVHADPVDPDTVYVLNVNAWRSLDGGRSIEAVRPNHGDTHALWIDPVDPEVMIIGDDGGAEVTVNGGGTFSSVLNQPTAEIYRVAVDHQVPYRVYGAQQDSSTLSLRSTGDGEPQDWYAVGGCESGHIAVDPRDANVVYAGCYIGEITRYDRATGERRPISVYPVLVDGVAPRELEHRFQWNAPILISRWDPDVVYHTSNTVNRTRDEGRTWEVISPDLTRDDAEKQEIPGGPLQHDHTSVEVYGTVFALAESPHALGELWAGSDDGMVWVTRDDGDSWTEVTPPDLPVDGTVNTIDVSSHRPGVVTVAVQRFRMDDWAPYVFRTEDGGATWLRLDAGLPAGHPVRAVREDPDREGLLFAGTEFGLFVSFDAGRTWESLQLGLPITPITDIVVHRQDLVVATQGRGIWILDDLSLLHQLDATTGGATSGLFTPRAAIRAAGAGGRPAAIFYTLPDDGVATLEVLDPRGAPVRFWSTTEGGARELPGGPGFHRLSWDLRYPGTFLAEDALIYLGYSGGPSAVPGAYTLRLTSAGQVLTAPLDILADPRRPDVTVDDLAATFALSSDLQSLLERSQRAIETLREIRTQATAAAERATAAGVAGAEHLAELATSLSSATTAIENELVQTRAEARQDPINFPPMLDNQIGYLYRYVVGTYGRPGQPAYARYDDLTGQLARLVERLEELVQADVAEFNRAAAALDQTVFEAYSARSAAVGSSREARRAGR